MSNELKQPLPVAVIADDDESGLSYVMRSLYANGMSMEKARSWLGIKSWYSLNRQELSLVAWHLGVSRDWLQWRILKARTTGSFTSFGYLGCKFVAASLRQSKNAALCPECVRSKGFCRASWLLKCIVVCPEHRRPILERCTKCGQLISWLRPDVDVCNCGRYLMSTVDQEVVTDQLITWVRWIEWRIGLYSGQESEGFARHIPLVLNEMSLDGAMRLVISFGILEDAMQTIHVAAWKLLDNCGVIGTVARGLSRLSQIDSSLDSWGQVGSLVHMPILERMRSDGVDSTDIMNATHLVSALKKNPYRTWDRRIKLPHGQLSLFW
jgi:hypothetical protein